MKRKELEDNGKFLGTYRLKDGLYNVPDGECDIYLMDGNVYGVCNRKNSFSYNGKVKDTVFIGQFEDLINRERDREFTIGKIQMANKYMKRYSMSLAITQNENQNHNKTQLHMY